MEYVVIQVTLKEKFPEQVRAISPNWRTRSTSKPRRGIACTRSQPRPRRAAASVVVTEFRRRWSSKS